MLQSYLQYRRLGQAIQQQLDNEEAKRNTPKPRPPAELQLSGKEDARSEEKENPSAEQPADSNGSPLPNGNTLLGYALEGISARDRTTNEGSKGSQVFVVSWAGENDPMNPHNFTALKKVRIILTVSSIAFAVTLASSIDSAVIPQAAKDFSVSEVAESLATGIFLIGFGFGTLYAGPLSEVFGRNPVYGGSLFFFLIWIMASALSPNFGAQLVFRFLAGFSGSPALTMSGGTVADLYNPLEKTYGFPLFSIPGFGGPILGPIIAAWIGPSRYVSWRWTEWVSLIAGGLVFTIVVLSQPETFAPQLLKWKAHHLRSLTGDQRFRSEALISEETFWDMIKRNLARPFVLVKSELIIMLMTLYFSVIYIIMFTFFVGYPAIFTDVYGTSQGITNTVFVAMLIGVFMAAVLVPVVWNITKKHVAQRQSAGLDGIEPEQRLWFAMLGGSLSMPIALFWMAWTDHASISIWSPIIASTFFGYGVICVFTSGYMYIIDSYEIYAASALTFVALVRYLAAGGMTVVGLPFYGNMGPHWTMTILGCFAALMAPVPYALYIWGPKVREHSRFAVNKIE